MTMHQFITILCLLIIVSSLALSTSKEHHIKVITDVLQSFNKPSDVLSSLCWTNTMKKKLTESLVESDNPKSIKFVSDIKAKHIVHAERVIFMADIACEESTEFLRKSNSSKYFGRPYRWIIIDTAAANNNNVPLDLNEMHILPDSEVYVMQFQNNSYSISLIYKIKPHRDWIVENYGNWSTGGGLVVATHAQNTSIAMRRRDLRREIIVTSIVITDNSSLIDLDVLRHKEIDAVAKLGYHHLTPLYHFMNATRELVLTTAWGHQVNGTWRGMLGHIAEQKAEIAGVVVFIMKDRMDLIEYMSHPTASSVKFIFREPPLSYQNNLYLLPFQASVWYCIILFVAVLTVAMYVNAFWEAKKDAYENGINGTHVLAPNLSDVTVFVMSAISQQGSSVELKGVLGRFVIFILFLVFVFLYTAYSASIVVLLQSSSNQIRTLTDLLNSKLELGVEDTPYNRYWFMNEKDPIRRAIYEKKIAPSGTKPKFFDLTEGILQLQKKPFALNCNLGAAYKVMEKYFYEHEKCGLQEISYIQDDNPWQAVRKGSPYREIYKLGLLRNSEHGLNDRTNRIMFSKKPVCTVRGGSFVSVSLVDCYPVLLVLLYGMILGVLLLFVEILHHRKTANMFADNKIARRNRDPAIWSELAFNEVQ